jgi:hypothetical protein
MKIPKPSFQSKVYIFNNFGKKISKKLSQNQGMDNQILKLKTCVGSERCCPKLDPNFTSHKKGVEHNNKACIFI